jgi:hypothetical protein
VHDELAGEVAQQGGTMGLLTAEVVYFVSVTHDYLVFYTTPCQGIVAFAFENSQAVKKRKLPSFQQEQ